MILIRPAAICLFVVAALSAGCNKPANSMKPVDITQEELNQTAPERMKQDLEGTIATINKDDRLSAEQKKQMIDDVSAATKSRMQGQGTGP